MKFGTKAVHAGVQPDAGTGAIMTPIFQTSTYVQAAPGKHKGYEYARTQNPTRTALQNALAELENGKFALVFSSGMAAEDAFAKLLRPGDHVLAANDLYGGSYRLFTKVYEPYGIKFSFVDVTNLDAVEKHMTPSTKWIWAETPSNPLLRIADIEGLAAVAKKKGARLAIDNTFASPALQNPLDLGADLVMHSCTKYLGGHSDSVMGALVMKDPELHESLAFIQNSCGAVPGPQDCFLQLRGIKTLHLRMERHSLNAYKLAQFLQGHKAVSRVMYPGLKEDPGYPIAVKQMRDSGGMLAFELKDDSEKAVLRILTGTHYFSLAESLGGVESLIGHPATMTHASIPKEERIKAGLSDGLIRLSVGIEDPDDLIADLKKVLDGLS